MRCDVSGETRDELGETCDWRGRVAVRGFSSISEELLAMSSLAVQIRVTVLAASGLKRDGGVRAMSVYSLLWIDPAEKLATRVHMEAGPRPVWNEDMSFTLEEADLLLVPHPAITVQVVSETERRGRWWNTLLGTAYLPLAEIARMKFMKENPEDADILQLQLTTPSGHERGFISLSISLIDNSQGRGLSCMLALLSTESMVQAVIGYPVGFLPRTSFQVHQESASSGNHPGTVDLQAYPSSSGWDFPVEALHQLPDSGTEQYYSPGQQRRPSAYLQTPQPCISPCVMDHEPTLTSWQSRRSFAMAVIGGAVAGFVVWDILGAFFW